MGYTVCPYCEHEFVPDDYGDIVDIGNAKEECPKCERTMLIRAEMDIDFYTEKLPEKKEE